MTNVQESSGLTDLKLLEHFVRVAQTGSFSRAAVAVGITQSALSRHVRTLELELKQTLLRRTGRGVQLTDAGRCLFEHSQLILKQVECARREVEFARDAHAGHLTIGLPPSLGRTLSVSLITKFNAEFPKAKLAIVEGLSNHLIEWIKSGDIDLAVVHNPEPSPHIDAQPLLEEMLYLMSPVEFRTKEPAEEVQFADLPRYPLILPDRSTSIRRLLDTRAAHAGISIRIAYEVSSLGAILELVARGLGHTVMPPSVVYAQTPAAKLFTRLIIGPRLPCVVSLASSSQRQATPLFRDASKLLGDHVKRLLNASEGVSRQLA
ncbi:MAG: LysR family transcriptional regulator [Polaromonas sp.]